ncbi:hypothetical protein WJ972_00315 [Achromobacter insuavis]
MPAIFGVDAAGERVLPYARRDPYVVLAGRWDGLAFRGGRLAARARRASCLPRKAAAPAGRPRRCKAPTTLYN